MIFHKLLVSRSYLKKYVILYLSVWSIFTIELIDGRWIKVKIIIAVCNFAICSRISNLKELNTMQFNLEKYIKKMLRLPQSEIMIIFAHQYIWSW